MRGLALQYGEDNLTASTLPLSVDGLVVVASVALVALSQMRRAAMDAECATALAAAAERKAPLAAAVAPLPSVPPAVEPEPLPAPAPVSAPLPESDPVAESDPMPMPLPDPVLDPLPVPVSPPARVPLSRMEPVVPPVPWPARQPLPDPEPTAPPDAATAQLWAAARKAWRESVAAGKPLTAQALGARFGRKERWGRSRIREAKAELQAEQEVGDVAGGTNQQEARVPVGAGVQ